MERWTSYSHMAAGQTEFRNVISCENKEIAVVLDQSKRSLMAAAPRMRDTLQSTRAAIATQKPTTGAWVANEAQLAPLVREIGLTLVRAAGHHTDFLPGDVMETIYGRRIVVEFKMADGSVSQGVRIRVRCGEKCCSEYITGYLVDSYGASFYSLKGEYLLSLRDQYWVCPTHHAERQAKQA